MWFRGSQQARLWHYCRLRAARLFLAILVGRLIGLHLGRGGNSGLSIGSVLERHSRSDGLATATRRM
jgi:hypothetical protein